MGRVQHTTEQFIEKAKEIHGDKYDYSKAKYTKSCNKLIITCPAHGDFEQEANRHLQKSGCVKCGILYNIRNQSATTEQFIIKAKETHGDKYDYDKVEYIKSKSKVIINCKHHGEFQQKPNSHLRGQGCPKCSAERIAISLTLTQEDFINRALKVHDNKYDYSLSEYKNSYVKIKIGCKEHGIFEQTPITHLQHFEALE